MSKHTTTHGGTTHFVTGYIVPFLALFAFGNGCAHQDPSTRHICHDQKHRLADILDDVEVDDERCVRDSEPVCAEVMHRLERLALVCPEDDATRLAAASFALYRNDLEAARRHAHSRAGNGHFGAQFAVVRALVAIESGNPQLGVALLSNAISHYPATAEIHASLAGAHYALGQYHQAWAALERAAYFGAPKGDVSYHRGLVYEACGHTDQAVAAYHQAYRLDRRLTLAQARAQFLASPGEARPAHTVQCPVLKTGAIAGGLAPSTNDHDEIDVPRDLCPLLDEDFDNFEDEDGCPEPDNDADGIVDALDGCPLVPEVYNGVEDRDGCPDSGAIALNEGLGSIELREEVRFASGQSVVDPASYPTLNLIADLLQLRRDIERVVVSGHADAMGASDANLQLSTQRAHAVVDYLVGRGVDLQRLIATGLGAQQAKSTNATEVGRFENRRVSFEVARWSAGKQRVAPRVETSLVESGEASDESLAEPAPPAAIEGESAVPPSVLPPAAPMVDEGEPDR